MKLKIYKNDIELNEIDLNEDFGNNIGDSSFKVFIGRAKDCHICLDDPQVSRYHASLFVEKNQFIIEKVSEFGNLSRNGLEISKSALVSGDVIVIPPFKLGMTFENSPIVNNPIKEVISEPLTEVISPEKIIEIKEEAKPTAIEKFEEIEEIKEDEQLDDFQLEEDNSLISSNDDDFLKDETPTFEEKNEVDEVPQENQTGNNDYPVAEMGMDIGEASDQTQIVNTFASFELDIRGEYAPFDKYILTKDETFIGRDPIKCQIILIDPEVSQIHAVLKKTNTGYKLEDLNSSNGTVFNGARVNQADLKERDEFIIGSTTFTVRVKSVLLDSEKSRLMPVEADQEIEVEEVVESEVGFEEAQGLGLTGDDLGPKKYSLFSKDFWTNPANKVNRNRFVMYGGVAALLMWLFLGEDASTNKPKPKATTVVENNQNNIDPLKLESDRVLTEDEKKAIEKYYVLGKSLFEAGKFREANDELIKVEEIDPNYKEVQILKDLIKKAIAQIEQAEKEKIAEEERRIKQAKAKILVDKARAFVEEKTKVGMEKAKKMFAEILDLDPENFDVAPLKLEVEAWEEEQRRAEFEKNRIEKERADKVAKLQPGKNFFLKQRWFQAIDELEKFLQLKDMDEDLIQEGTKMLQESQQNLKRLVSPLLGKARSLKEAQDLKAAYDNYKQVLQHDPENIESLNELDLIREILKQRSMKIYREALISESLSLFDDAKEKYLEVQQISPTDSEYYLKASEKLKEYIY